MLMLALDTSTSAVSVALADESGTVATSHIVDARAHGELLAPGMRDVLAAAARAPREVTDVIVGVGPGPFTGLRVGLASGLTFGHVVGAQVRGVCSLDALAHRAWLHGVRERVLVATDARRKEVYWATYHLDDGGITAEDEPAVARATDLPESARALPALGRGAVLYSDVLARLDLGRHDSLDVHAADLADLARHRLAAGADLLDPTPLYLRRPDAVPSASVKSVLPR
ncbi:MAG: tRNA (adenosine(37)-N6)-threonylcarbamoyltransferase complex dimerization subunit type 1 TsaB [Mobilicoccus sp.]|nr:tRNA (adenosine(37)-N6)-threonylcarbamoyltransferase complex dimerization subunit type 1 TsaB [Mobilicoccus sp.]